MEHPTCFILAVGSLINDDSRAASCGERTEPACAARLLPSAGYIRSWSFRAASGFTALGLQRSDTPTPINGIVFAVRCADLPRLDERERGYERVAVPLAHVQLLEGTRGSASVAEALQSEAARVWAYVPTPDFVAPPSEAYPLLQTYIDVVLNGCLAWGGEAFAAEFVATTTAWAGSPWLNDVPASRRPWLNRGPLYGTIDALLHDHVAQRRHPEEFAAARRSVAGQLAVAGCWGVAKRNVHFVGREPELAALRARLLAGGDGGVSVVELVGLGGVGKSQLAAEYCWRYQGGGHTDGYGLVAWLRAETAETAAADLRRLAADCGVAVRDRPAAEVVEEMKSLLFRSPVSWLLIFDNVESPELLDAFLPRGARTGHVLVTSRRVLHPQRALVLDCLAAADAVAFLRAAGGAGDPACAAALAEQLGFLPLALAMAAAYMRRADVSCAEYLARVQARQRLEDAESSGGSPLSVATSLSLSLARIAAESLPARRALDALAYLAPDAISKPLLRALLRAVAAWPDETAVAQQPAPVFPMPMPRLGDVAFATGCAFTSLALLHRRPSRLRRAAAAVSSAGAAAAAALYAYAAYYPPATTITPPPATRDASLDDVALDSLTDAVWALLKTFSLLSVRERTTASMHRLLQAVIRGGHSAPRARACVRAGADALASLWAFKAADASTWPAAGALVEHVRALGRAAAAHGCRTEEAAALLTSAGAFTALALSRFPEAREMLETALALAQRGATGDTPAVADALFELGKVLRYLGDLSAAESASTRALAARQLAVPDAGACPRVAAALHELGVLRLRSHDHCAGTQLLNRALAAKRAAGAPGADVASTLHQLAIAAMNARPPQLTTAERLLREALTAGGAAAGDGGAGAAAAAATLQQLGRLELRRGRLDEAQAALERAGELARQAYGSELHINVAAVEHALGACAASRGDATAAAAHLDVALRIRRAIYAGVPHRELAATLGALGKCAHSAGQLEAAAGFYAEQRTVLEALAEDGPPDAQASAACELRANLKWARAVARDAGDDVAAAQLAKLAAAGRRDELRDRSALEEPSVDFPVRVATPAQAAALRCRAAVRAELRDAASAGRPLDPDALAAAVATLRHALAREGEGSLPEAVAAFAAALAGPFERGPLFRACDALREALRCRGIRVEDHGGG